MRTSTIVSTLAVAASAMGQMMNTTRPANTSMCDYYAKLTNHPQYVLLTALVNTAVIGNYSNGSMNAVTGILNNGTYEGRPVSLLKYFDGMLASTNRGGDSGVSVNFLDGGAADPLKINKPANDTSSNQYFLLTHLYSYFGALLNCSDYGQMGFPAYSGGKSQYEVHKFMDLSHDEVSYFIQEVGLAATSFGVSAQDATSVGMALGKLFNYKCAPETTVIPAQGPALQSICIADDCPTAANSSCAAYQKDKISMPVASNDTNKYTSTSMMPTGTAAAGGSGSGTDSASSTTESGAAATMHAVGAVAMGIAGFAALAAGL